ncbi:MAG: hypothetical protein L0206_03990, partial [Actinobacteria bacterium]|nr:hypothetical protein [Actinomycetota bacterium]
MSLPNRRFRILTRGLVTLVGLASNGPWLLACDASGAVERVRRVDLLSDFRKDFQDGYEWKPSDVVEMLRANPDAYVLAGQLSGYVPGSPLLTAMGRRIDSWQDAIRRYNETHDPDLDMERICIDWRPDVVLKHIDGSGGEENCGS